MTDITHDEIRELLPDLLHGGLDARSRALVDRHFAECGECREEMEVLRMVMDAPSFAPSIDAVKIASQIAPYGGNVQLPPTRAPQRSWQLVAMLAAAVILLSVVIFRGATSGVSGTNSPSVATVPAVQPIAVAVAPVGNTLKPAANSVPAKTVSRTVRQLQLAEGLDGLSDASVAQLLREMNDVEALPAVDPEPLGVGEGSGESGRGSVQ